MKFSNWFFRGLIAWLSLSIILNILTFTYSFVHASVQFLPRFLLAWVPGLNVLWWVALIFILGKLCCDDTVCNFLGSYKDYIEYFRSLCGFKYETVCCSVNGVYVIGKIVDKFEKDGQVWASVACGTWPFQFHLLMPFDTLLIMDESHHCCDDVCDVWNEHEGE